MKFFCFFLFFMVWNKWKKIPFLSKCNESLLEEGVKYHTRFKASINMLNKNHIVR